MPPAVGHPRVVPTGPLAMAGPEARFLTVGVGLVPERLAAERVAVESAMLVVAKAWLVVGEEDLADQVPAAANAGLLEDLLEVLLDGVGRDDEPLGDLGRRVAAQDQPGHLLLALGEAIGRHQKGRDSRRMRRLDDHRRSARTRGDKRGAVKDDPGPRAGEHTGNRDLARFV